MTNIKLGDLCKSCAGQIKVEDGELIDYIDISSIDNEKKKLIGFQTMPFGESPSRARKVVKKGSILVSTVRPNLNAIAVLENDTPNISVASTGFCILDCKDDVDNRFVFNFCKSRKFIDDMVSKATGASYPAVSDKIIRSALVPNYTYEEQCNISKVLDSISDIIDKREAELFSLDELIKARFVEMFGDVKHEEKYKGIPLRELCITMSGGTPPTKNIEYYEGNIPWITTVSLGPNHIDGSTAKGYITQDAIKNSATKLIPAGNILFGTRVGVGKSSINDVDICTNQDIIAIIGIDENRFNRVFIKHVLDDYQPYYDSLKKGATILGITSDDLEDTLIPDVPIDVQMEYVAFVDQVDKSKVAVQKALDETQLLFDSLMQKYFG